MVEGQAKHDAVYPTAELFSVTQGVKILEGAQERLLRDLLGIGGITQDAVSDLKDTPLVFRHTRGKSRLRFGHHRLGLHCDTRTGHADLSPYISRHHQWPVC